MKRATKSILLGAAAAIAIFAALVATTPLGRRPESNGSTRDLAITGARIGDARSDADASTLIIRNGRIAAIGRRDGDVSIPGDIPTLDARGAFVVPGLVNAHTHMLRAGSCGRDEGFAYANIAQIARNFDVTLRHGHTTVVDLGAPLHPVVKIRDALAAEETLSPRLFAAGPVLTAPGGYPLDFVDRTLASRLGVVIELPDRAAAARAIEQIHGAGVDVVKIISMELAYNERPLPALDPEVFRAAVDEAHARHLRVFVHAHSAAGYRAALDAGTDVIAHSAFDPLPDDVIARVVTSSVAVIPTLWVFASFEAARTEPGALLRELEPQLVPGIYGKLAEFHARHEKSGDAIPPDFLPGLSHSRLDYAMRNARDNLKKLAAAGATIAYGTDTSFCYALHGSAHRELGEMVQAGLTPRQAYAAATLGSARALGRRDLGIIELGAAGDLLVLDADPRLDPAALAHPRTVIRDGRIYAEDPEPPGLLRTARVFLSLLAALLGV